MKKVLAILLVVTTMFLNACAGSSNKWKPATASDDIKPYGEQAFEIIEQYLNFDIDAKSADDKIGLLLQRINNMGIDEDGNEYNKADKVIARVIELLGLVSIKYKSDISLKQDLDVLSVQLGKKPSGKTYDPKDFTYSEEEEGVDAFINIQTTTAVNYSVREHDNSYTLQVYFDAMYGTKVTEVSACIEEILNNIDGNELHFVRVYYSYYDQDVFSIMLTVSDTSDVKGRIFKDDYDDILGEFENKEQLDKALKQAVNFAK